MTGNPTLYDVAREAGVSLATASRSLNGSERRVKDEYRQRVLAAAAKLGYTPNLSAQAVARGGSSTVALLVSDIADPYFSTIAAGVIRAAEAEGLVVTMAVTGRDADREIELVRMLRGQRPRVIVLAGSRFADEPSRATLVAELEAFESTGGRVVVIGQAQLPFPTVTIDNAGAELLATRLVELGYRGFAILGGPATLLTARDRVEAFQRGLGDLAATVVHSAFTRDAGYEAAMQLDLDGIDLVFAVNDVMAIGALSALRDRGITVPEQVAVAGYDDIATAQDVTPPLTTVRLDLAAAGAAAVAGADALIGATVVVRDSTPPR